MAKQPDPPETVTTVDQSQFTNVILEGLKEDLGKREKYANGLYSMMMWWLVGIAVFLLVDGVWSAVFTKPFLSDAVILALIGGTTASVIGLFTVVVSYLFPSTSGSTVLGTITNYLFSPSKPDGADQAKLASDKGAVAPANNKGAVA
jgi:hypothetical protein